jgi:hypothetical protein
MTNLQDRYGHPQEMPRKLQAIKLAKDNADIDGYGDEGAGFDYDEFARELERLGWHYTGNDQPIPSIYRSSSA